MKRSYRFTLFLIIFVGYLYLTFMSILSPDEQFMIYLPFEELVPGWFMLSILGWVAITIGLFVLLKKKILRIGAVIMMINLLIGQVTLLIQSQGINRYFLLTSPTDVQLLIREHPSWLSTEIDFFLRHPLIGWTKVGNDESTADFNEPFTQGDYTVTWTSTYVEVTWLFDDDEGTYHTVQLPLTSSGD